jgi:hypothetical protein
MQDLKPDINAHAHVLGGSATAPLINESVAERRQRIIEATMNRLRKEEEELEDSCGTAGPASRDSA